MVLTSKRLILYFNPRSHERSDDCLTEKAVNEFISIHAPTRGATLVPVQYKIHKLFQSTLPREERPDCILRSTASSQFQSTLPREERPAISVFLLSITSYFNPRSHERSDPCRLLFSHASNISIHAPTRGATYTAYRCIS